MRHTTLMFAAAMMAGILAQHALGRATWTVCPDGGCDFTSIPEAVDAAMDGDVILIQSGFYAEGQVIDIVDKSITLRGPDDLSATLSGQGTHRVIQIRNDGASQTVVENLRIEDGLECCPGTAGGMMILECDPTIRNCRFQNNEAIWGAALYVKYSSAVISDCRFENNRCSFYNLSYGAGITSFYSSITVTDCDFIGNEAVSFGGAVHNLGSNGNVYQYCSFISNSSGDGGGAMTNFSSTPTIIACAFQGNVTGGSGHSIYSPDGGIDLRSCIFTECCQLAPPLSYVDPKASNLFNYDLYDGTSLPYQSCPACRVDIDCNGAVGGGDLALILSEWGSSNVECDVTADGVVDGADLGVLLGSWGPCP